MLKFQPLELKDVRVYIWTEPEDITVEESFELQENIDYVHAQIKTGSDWAWCTVWVKVEWEGYRAEANLGCCSYESEKDFRNCDYFADLQQRALDELNEELEKDFQILIKRAV